MLPNEWMNRHFERSECEQPIHQSVFGKQQKPKGFIGKTLTWTSGFGCSRQKILNIFS
jgi:hypothetical protein